MPGIVTTSPCRELDRIALAEASSAFGAIFFSFDDILPMHNDRRMTRQADRSGLRAPDANVEKQRMQPGHMDGLLGSVLPFAGKIQIAMTKLMAVQAKR